MDKDIESDLYNMKLGERVFYDSGSCWLRVPDGWVYSDMQGCCFVPFHNEFMEVTLDPDELPFK